MVSKLDRVGADEITLVAVAVGLHVVGFHVVDQAPSSTKYIENMLDLFRDEDPTCDNDYKIIFIWNKI